MVRNMLEKPLTSLGTREITVGIMTENVFVTMVVWKSEIRFNGHFGSIRHNGFLKNVSITPIDKADKRNLKREKIFGGNLKSYSLFGHNGEDSAWPSPNSCKWGTWVHLSGVAGT